MLIELF